MVATHVHHVVTKCFWLKKQRGRLLAYVQSPAYHQDMTALMANNKGAHRYKEKQGHKHTSKIKPGTTTNGTYPNDSSAAARSMPLFGG